MFCPLFLSAYGVFCVFVFLCFLFVFILFIVKLKKLAVGKTLKYQFVQLYLAKSKVGCNVYPYCVDIAIQCMSDDQSINVVLAGLVFTKQIVHNVNSTSKSQFATHSPKLAAKLIQLITNHESELELKLESKDNYDNNNNNNNNNNKTKEKSLILTPDCTKLVYQILGDLSGFRCNDSIFSNNLSKVKFLFERLEIEIDKEVENNDNDAEVKQSVIYFLNKMQNSFLRKTKIVSNLLKTFLFLQRKSKYDDCKWVALEWLNNLYPFNDSVIRLENLFEIDSKNKNIKKSAVKSFVPSTFKQFYEKVPEFDEEKDYFKQELYPSFEEFVAIAHKNVMVCCVLFLLALFYFVLFSFVFYVNCFVCFLAVFFCVICIIMCFGIIACCLCCSIWLRGRMQVKTKINTYLCRLQKELFHLD